MADKALLVGINNYREISDLRGCLNDVKDMEKLLIEVYGFKADNIQKLTDQQATKRQLLQQMRWLFRNATEGSRLVFHFSGHGSYTVDLDKDDEKGYDELLCLYDMSWDNADSYLLDDEIREWVNKLPGGARLLVVLDNCHSGTGTRLLLGADGAGKPQVVDIDATMARAVGGPAPAARDAAVAASEALRQPEHLVIARFVPPPPEIERRIRERQLRRGAGIVVEESLNHVLLAACRDNQTAADAWISGRYNGAFTHHLCQALRAGGKDIDRSVLIEQVAHALRDGSFDQVPQLEGNTRYGPLFEQGSDKPAGGSLLGIPVSPGAPGDLSQQILAKLDRLVQLMEGRTPPPVAPVRAEITRYVVYVHGIGQHAEEYSDPWWEAMEPYVSSLHPGKLGEGRLEVIWSDLVNRARRLASSSEEAQARELTAEIEGTIEDRIVQEAARTTRGMAAQPGPVPRGTINLPGWDDFIRYMVSSSVRSQVLDRFTGTLEPLVRAGKEVVVISHSWGTVVAYEGLRRLDGLVGGAGAVPCLFTLGSPLSIWAVRRSLLPTNRDGRRPALVRRWINVDAEGDAVGGPLQGHFGVDHEYLNVHPEGCTRSWWGYSLACAHGSYFDRTNLGVNRGILGRHVEE